jgi:alpha-tubulin suppressor-like RCC1 family protein
LEDVKQIVAGYAHTCALVGSGAVRYWGANAHGQLGDGTRTSRPSPTPIAGLTDVLQLALGMDHSCALRSDHSVVCWGSNADKHLGSDREGDSLTPVAVRRL